jgi:hypothetical protein
MRCLPKPSRGRFFLPLFARVRGGRFSEVGVFRSSHQFLLLEMLNVLDWWDEAVLDMLLWATRVVS